jgi:hypothetical protein
VRLRVAQYNVKVMLTNYVVGMMVRILLFYLGDLDSNPGRGVACSQGGCGLGV